MKIIHNVLLLEDKPDTCAWLNGMLAEAIPQLKVYTASSLKEARQLLKTQQKWKFAVIDLGLPDGSGIDFLHELKMIYPDTEAIITTIYDDDDNLFGAIAAGAKGYLLKSQPTEVLVRQLQQFDAGTPPISPSIARRILTWFRDHPPEITPTTRHESADIQLSGRDIDVLTCIGRGMRVSEAAKQLGLTENTIASYIKQIYRKLDINSRAEAALEAARRGLV